MSRRPARDGQGRWQKGFCPNPTGRPRKKTEISDADVNHFRNGIQVVTINGEQRHLTRHEALLHAMYDKAMKGSVLVMRKLFDRFEQSDSTMVEAQSVLRDLKDELLEKYRKNKVFDEKLNREIEELNEAVHGGHKPRPRRKPRLKVRDQPALWRKGQPQPQAVQDLLALEDAQYWAVKAEEYFGELAATAVWMKTKAREAQNAAATSRHNAMADPGNPDADRALAKAEKAARLAAEEADAADAQVDNMFPEVEKAKAELAEAEARYDASSRLQDEARNAARNKLIAKK